MPGLFVCPYCQATVQPTVAPDGRKTCPQCRNTGVRTARPAGAPAPAPAGVAPTASQAPPLPSAPGAVAALVCGIVGVVTGILGIVLGIVAIVLANRAEAEIKANPGRFSGEGLASAGRILGIVGLVVGALSVLLVIAMFAMMGALVGAFAEAATAGASFHVDADANQVVVSQVWDDADWSEFTVSGTAGCVLPSGAVDVDDVVQCAGDGTVRIARDGETVFSGRV